MEELSPAQKMYQQHLRNVSNYQKRNAEKMREKQRKRLEVIKQDPEKYEELRKKRKEYNEARKYAYFKGLFRKVCPFAANDKGD